MIELAREISPFQRFTREEWARLRADTPMTLSVDEIEQLRSLNDRADIAEVEEIYLPLSRLLNLYVAGIQGLYKATQIFLNSKAHKTPYIIGIAGSVAVGKSTTARLLKHLLAHWPHHPKVDLVTTDGFLMPNAILEAKGLMARKGFPESYDRSEILRFLWALKSGRRHLEIPLYSHLTYDRIHDKNQIVDQPDILILEGVNVLQTGRPSPDGRAVPNVSDFFDFSIYIDADPTDLRAWYIDRFLSLRDGAFRNPQSYFHRYAALNDLQARATATQIWDTTNLLNLYENILPTRPRADLVLRKSTNHLIRSVFLRKL